jgi:arylsulfatase A-like enzyme
MDTQVARLVNSLRQLELWDDCVFALTADHGEEFLEHGGRYHAPLRFSEEIVRVPLLIRVPGAKGKPPSSPMSHLHLAPTLLETMGVQSPKEFQGRSLWTNLERGNAWTDPAIMECAYGCTNPFRPEARLAPRLVGVRDTRFKLVLRLEPGATEEVYDLQADPAEIGPAKDRVALESRKRLLTAARELWSTKFADQDSTLRLRARLRDICNQTLG